MDNQLPNLPPSLQDDQQQQYIYELNDRDVLCGRGSGPNDRKLLLFFTQYYLSQNLHSLLLNIVLLSQVLVTLNSVI